MGGGGGEGREQGERGKGVRGRELGEKGTGTGRKTTMRWKKVEEICNIRQDWVMAILK